jgi:hypothetical protein
MSVFLLKLQTAYGCTRVAKHFRVQLQAAEDCK